MNKYKYLKLGEIIHKNDEYCAGKWYGKWYKTTWHKTTWHGYKVGEGPLKNCGKYRRLIKQNSHPQTKLFL